MDQKNYQVALYKQVFEINLKCPMQTSFKRSQGVGRNNFGGQLINKRI